MRLSAATGMFMFFTGEEAGPYKIDMAVSVAECPLPGMSVVDAIRRRDRPSPFR